IAVLVVARVELLAKDATVLGDLLSGLGRLSAGEHTTRGDAAVDEADVVRAAVERDRLADHPALGPVLGEHPLDRAGAFGPGVFRAERRTVAVVDEPREVRR